MAVRTIVLSRHVSNLAGPVIIHDIIHGLIYVPSRLLHVVDFLGSRRMGTAPTSTEALLRPTRSQSDEPSDLRGSLSPTSIYSTERRIPYPFEYGLLARYPRPILLSQQTRDVEPMLFYCWLYIAEVVSR